MLNEKEKEYIESVLDVLHGGRIDGVFDIIPNGVRQVENDRQSSPLRDGELGIPHKVLVHGYPEQIGMEGRREYATVPTRRLVPNKCLGMRRRWWMHNAAETCHSREVRKRMNMH